MTFTQYINSKRLNELLSVFDIRFSPISVYRGNETILLANRFTISIKTMQFTCHRA